MVTSKTDLRKSLRKARRDHVAAQPDAIRALLFHRPPRPVVEHIAANAVIGLYSATNAEAPATGYARFFQENGHTLALPRFAGSEEPMAFAEHTDPFNEGDLVKGPLGILQPGGAAMALIPDVIFVPLIGFTASGNRLGQGGGHYDRWLAEHPGTQTIGLAWDVQLIEPEDALHAEPHDIALDCVVTPTRIYGKNDA